MQHRSYVPAFTETHACMHVSMYNSIHTFEYACVRSAIHVTITDILLYVDMWQCASIGIHTHMKKHTYVPSKCMVLHPFRSPIQGQRCPHMLLYRTTYVERDILLHTRAFTDSWWMHQIMWGCTHMSHVQSTHMIQYRRSSTEDDTDCREANVGKRANAWRQVWHLSGRTPKLRGSAEHGRSPLNLRMSRILEFHI